MPDRFRVLVVDDSLFMRKYISDLLKEDPMIWVAGTASNGEEALKKLDELRPDVVTMDLEMPVMDGLLALEEIMKRNPTPVIMVSNYTQLGADLTVKALQLGAVDFVAKPSGNISLNLEQIREELISKVKIAAQAKRRILPQIDFVSYNVLPANRSREKVEKKLRNIVAIGTSTGGPRALQDILSKLPAFFPAGIVVVQHMPRTFTASLAKRLNDICSMSVKEACHGDRIEEGKIYIAPGDKNLEVYDDAEGCQIRLKDNPVGNINCPSVDIMMSSVANCQVSKLGVILTGMGKDGAQGIQRIKSKGGITVAEDESTSIVYGMPRAAVETGCVDYVVPVSNIAALMINLLN